MRQQLANLLALSPGQRQTLDAYWRLMRIDRPVGTLLILWPTLSSLWLGSSGLPSLKLLIIFVLGTFLMRSAGCVINDYLDRHIDGAVSRTRNRPLATAELRPEQALICFAMLCILALGLVLLTNGLTLAMAFVGALLVVVYPTLKRVTHLPQLWLGLAMNWGMIMAWTAATGALEREIWVLYLGAVLWTLVYDTCYAMVDRPDDLRIGVKSTAILFGEQDRLIIGILQSLTLLTFWLGGHLFELGPFYYLALMAIGALFVWQQWLIRKRDADGCFTAFINNQWVGLLLFLGILFDIGL